MTTRMWIILRPLVALLLVGTSAAAAPNPRLRKLAVVGDSVLAGFASGGLVATGRVGQRDSAPALVARRAHVAFSQPLMTGPGLPPPLVIVDEDSDGVLDPGDVRRAIDGLGFRREPGRIVRNLAVPGEDLRSVFETTAPGTITQQLLSGSADGRELMKFAILGLPARSEGVSQLTRIQEIRPTFVLVWLGNNDVLPMATRTDPASVTMSAAEFGQRYRQLLNALADTGVGGMAVANLPDVTALAALRPAGSEVTVCRADDGTATVVAPDDLLAIDLPRDRLPEPPCGRVLDAAERAAVRATVVRFNDEIASAVADVETSRGMPIALVDVFALFDRLRSSGIDGLTSRYLGGVFSLDGVHPTRTGQALIANAFIDAIDVRFGEAIAEVDVDRVAARDPFVGNRFRPLDEPPFGVIASEDVDELFDGAFRRIERDRRRLARDLVRRGRGLFDDLKDLVGL